MKPAAFLFLVLSPLCAAPAGTDSAGDAPNRITAAEAAAGWRLLWDGVDSHGWRSAKGPDFPAFGWEMKDGVLTVLESGGQESRSGGDIITTDRFSNFELQLDFRITAGANSGIKYFVQPDLNRTVGSERACPPPTLSITVVGWYPGVVKPISYVAGDGRLASW